MVKILFVISGLTHGGANKSLENLLNLLDLSQYRINIYSIYTSGPYDKVFQKYNLLPPIGSSLLLKSLIRRGIKKNSAKIDFFTRLDIHFFTKKYLKSVASELSKNEYDIVVSFQEGFATVLGSFIKAKKHIAWVHCDYSRYVHLAKKDYSDVYSRFDNIVGVSNYTAEVFKKIIPSVKERVLSIHNVIDTESILNKSNESVSFQIDSNVLSLVSVGRMDPVKRFAQIPKIAKTLKEREIKFNWYIVGGGGSEETKVKNEIKINDVDDCVFVLGQKDNPYAYMSRCSSLVCLSESEACPNVISEGMILRLLVICTDFPSSIEFVKNNENGIICPIEKIGDSIENIYRDHVLFESIKAHLNNYTFDNYRSLKQINNLFHL